MLKKLMTIVFLVASGLCFGQSADKRITFGNNKLRLTLDYNKTANISQLVVNGEKVAEGIYSMIRTKSETYSTLQLAADPVVKVDGGVVRVTGIKYGPSIAETWTFVVTDSAIRFDIERVVPKAIEVEKIASPRFMFSSMNVWEGAYQDYGGLAWFYLFNKRRDTYGVYSKLSEFWNSKTGNGLAVSVAAPGKHVAMDYSRTVDDQLAYSIAVSPVEMRLRFDSGTQRRRYTRDTTDVWAGFATDAGTSSEHITLSYFNFEERYGRGRLVGVNQSQVSSVLNTILRIGVIGKQHFGGNSWHTPYGPICLHEQYIAQMGLGINDKKYLKGYQDCLDFYRDNAIKADGRVWPRWAYSNEDAMPGAYTGKGFYEAQWGYLLDSNPDYVIDVSELYDQTGDLGWVKGQQRACEKALNWIIKRDGNNNGLVEMMTDSYKQKRGSDWIDIIWAAYENAFVNAKLYRALVLWAEIESQLGNSGAKAKYAGFAERLKASFNKPVSEGGFWDAEKKCYVHWRDKDGSIHGSNMVTPVNFMAIAYDICEDGERKREILDGIEGQMVKEHLFFWPLCLYSYGPGEGNDWQFPFPNYENGDIFLSWGSVAVKAYASYKPELALKYVKNVLKQYSVDGLAFQRYGRARQDGRGDDILSGNGLSVVGLYQAIYGINPLYNRFYLDPHITGELAGTEVKYNYRDKRLTIGLDMDRYSVSDGRFTVVAKTDFGFYSKGNELLYFNGKSKRASMRVTAGGAVSLDIQQWTAEKMVFTLSAKGAVVINGLKLRQSYMVSVGGVSRRLQSSDGGALSFEAAPGQIILSRL